MSENEKPYDSVYTQELCDALLARIDRLEKTQVTDDALPITAKDRPDDSTTRILRAWIGFLDVLFREGVHAEYTIDNTELARIFSLDIASFRKLLNPSGMKNYGFYSSNDRINFVAQAKALPEKLLLAHETEAMRDNFYGNAAIRPVGEKAWDFPSRGYITGNEDNEKMYGSGYNTYKDNARRAGDPIDEM